MEPSFEDGFRRSPTISHITDILERADDFGLSSPRLRSVGILLESMTVTGSDAAIALLELPRPCDHDDHFRFSLERYVSEFLKKTPWLPIDDNRKANAIQAFLESETHCADTNRRLARDPEPSWFERVRDNIAMVLGPLDHDQLDRIVESMRHGPGATVGIRGEGTVGSDKYRHPITLTAPLRAYWQAIAGPTWVREQPHVRYVRGGKWSSVTKNALTDRGISTEPTLNAFGQLGIGAEIARRLLRVGVNLRDQQWNQYLASVAWDSSLVTLDLKGASDHVAYETVRSLFPADWLTLLLKFRSPEVQLGDEWIKLEKFSTMGNGYTFALESLIFWAVIASVVPRLDRCLTAVYGDDLVVPSKYAMEVIDRLEHLGFKVNEQKSCLAGNFYESCGSDFIRGANCRPYYAPSSTTDPIPIALKIANGWKLWGRRIGIPAFAAPFHTSVWESAESRIPSVWRRTCVPASWESSGVIRDEPIGPWVVKDPLKKGYGWEGFLARAIAFIPREKLLADHRDSFVVLAGLRQIGGENPCYGYEPRKGIYGRPVSRYAFVPFWD